MKISLWKEKANGEVRHLAGVEKKLSDERSREERKKAAEKIASPWEGRVK